MQNASEAYIQSMRGPIRNRGYIKGTIGIINSEAQNNATVDNGENDFTYFNYGDVCIAGLNLNKTYLPNNILRGVNIISDNTTILPPT